MYKYLLFAFDSYESCGGMSDLAFKFNTLDELINNYVFEDLYIYQLVDVKDFTYKEYSPKIIYHVGVDDYNEVKDKRRKDFIDWVTLQIT